MQPITFDFASAFDTVEHRLAVIRPPAAMLGDGVQHFAATCTVVAQSAHAKQFYAKQFCGSARQRQNAPSQYANTQNSPAKTHRPKTHQCKTVRPITIRPQADLRNKITPDPSRRILIRRQLSKHPIRQARRQIVIIQRLGLLSRLPQRRKTIQKALRAPRTNRTTQRAIPRKARQGIRPTIHRPARLKSKPPHQRPRTTKSPKRRRPRHRRRRESYLNLAI